MGCAASAPKDDPVINQPAAEPDVLASWNAMAAAWGSGAFAGKDKKQQLARHMENVMVWDATSGAGCDPIFKLYNGIDGFLQWLDMIGDFDWAGLEMLPILGAQPRTVMHRFSSTATNKATGRSFTGFTSDMIVWKYAASGKVESAKIWFGQPEQYAYVLSKDGSFPRPATLAVMPKPNATPEKVYSAFAEVYSTWGTGKFSIPEEKGKAMDDKWAKDLLMDTTSFASQALGIFKLRHGHEGGDEWVNGVLGEWELSNLDMDLSGVPHPDKGPPGPLPGTVAQLFTYDVKHKVTGKELKGQCDVLEWYMSDDGKVSAFKFYFGNPMGIASLYPTPPPVPDSVALFFDGTGITDEKVAKIGAGMADNFELEFVGPYTGMTTGVKMPKGAVIGKVMPLFASAFAGTFIFNADKATVQKQVDGGYAASIRVTGTHCGTPFTPDPEKLPPVEASSPPKGFDIGPETFTAYVNDEGLMTKLTICPQHAGAPNGPPAIYLMVGGSIPVQATPNGAEKVALLKSLESRMFDGTLASICTDDCVVSFTGASMPAAAMAETCVAAKAAFPDWVCKVGEPVLLPGGAKVQMGTQQSTGAMQADMEAIGPFPKATLAEAPAPIKEAPGLILPVELGVFTFNADGTKIASMTWDGSLGDTSEANTMEVGMPVLYAAMGKTLG